MKTHKGYWISGPLKNFDISHPIIFRAEFKRIYRIVKFDVEWINAP